MCGVLANINKVILLVRPLRCDSLTRETSGEMLPITPLQMKYRLSGTIHEGHQWPDVTVCVSACEKCNELLPLSHAATYFNFSSVAPLLH